MPTKFYVTMEFLLIISLHLCMMILQIAQSNENPKLCMKSIACKLFYYISLEILPKALSSMNQMEKMCTMGYAKTMLEK